MDDLRPEQGCAQFLCVAQLVIGSPVEDRDRRGLALGHDYQAGCFVYTLYATGIHLSSSQMLHQKLPKPIRPHRGDYKRADAQPLCIHGNIGR
ncbi:hypothetical protein D3C76_1009740 [compost metagenome]